MSDAPELVNDLQEMRDDGFLSDALLRHAVKTIEGWDERFHWVGAFLLRDGGEEMWLHNYVGEPAQYAEVSLASGVHGTAVAQAVNQNVPDVTALDDFTPCGPDIRSKLVVLIRAGDDVFGEIDLESEDESAFTDEDEAAVQAVSDKLAEQIISQRR